MKSFMQLARIGAMAAWKVKFESTDDDAAKAAWLALPYSEQQLWVAAAKAIADEVKHIH